MWHTPWFLISLGFGPNLGFWCSVFSDFRENSNVWRRISIFHGMMCHFALFWLLGYVYFQHIMFTCETCETCETLNKPPHAPLSPPPHQALFSTYFSCLLAHVFLALHGSTCSLNNFHSQKSQTLLRTTRFSTGLALSGLERWQQWTSAHQCTIKDGWYVMRKQFSVGFQFPG